ncbi:hypothetical protein CVT24_012525 [Panaeolus cyanescens]|uniref:F-box domain-containing protein n=1 Tax=Panaeolus cyanescens TaxID=181874 RepID=A0A409YK28_9AGAR|nr:hypothetical protein CVT24_012525 [Panaeolus cyanescens]
MLTELPPDILIHILSQLKPRDIISTCKTLASVSRQKTIWIKAIDRMCPEESLFRPSFPTDESSISRLEAISAGPIKWKKLFTRSGVRPRATPVRGCLFSVSDVFEDPLEYLFLVPGGRFLVAHNSDVLAVFDLDSPNSMEPVLSTKLSGDPVITCVHPARDEEKLHVALVSMFVDIDDEPPEPQYFAEIHEISLSTRSEYAIRKIAGYDFLERSIDDDEIVHLVSMSYDTLAVLCSGIMRVWRFTTDEWNVFRLDCEPVHGMTLLEEDILFFHSSSISIYSAWERDTVPRASAFPSYTGLGEYNRDQLACIKPRSERKLAATDASLDGTMMEGLDSWFTGSRPYTYFERHTFSDINSQDEDEECDVTIDTYFLEHSDANSDMTTTDAPLRHFLTFTFKNVFSEYPSTFKPCGGVMYRLVHDRYGLYCQSVIRRSDQTKETYETRIMDPVLYLSFFNLPHEAFDNLTTFCPASGKLCCVGMDSETDEADNTIHVLDFF